NARGADPGEITEAVGDADPVQATGLGVKNLARVMKMLLPATEKKGEDWENLEDMYGRVLGQWTREMLHVAGVVGGVDSHQKNGGQAGLLFTTIPAARQRKAVEFLSAQAFATPAYLVDPAILRRIEPDGVLARLRNAQSSVLESLLTPTRVQRMTEQEVLDGDKAYKPLDLLADLRRGIFTELAAPAPKIDAFRRNLQQTYLEAMHNRVNGGAAPPTHRWLYRGELKSLSGEIARALPRTSDRPTRLFLEDAKEQIARILDPKFAPPASPSLSLPLR
ncbi:MAG: zinc-dependent metalloprotease, partial [Acidobacteriota bacterium]